MPSRLALAVDIGGTKTAAALVAVGADDARVLAVRTAPTPAWEGSDAVLTGALDLADCVRAEAADTSLGEGAAGGHIEALGIASAGVVDTVRGAITHATDALPGWAGTDIAGPARERFGVPVSVLNDVHGHGVGEARFGVGRGRSSLLLAAIGTGIGGCHLVDGAPVTGAHGAAGHIGHVTVPEADGIACTCGRTGHLEGLASGPGILALAARLGAVGEDGAPVSRGADLAARAARAPGSPAAEAYRLAGRATGRMLGGLLNVLDVDAVALTGGVAAVGEPWTSALAEGIAAEAMDVVAATPLLPAAAGTHAALLGAAAWTLDGL